jgi:hypothetical protein
MSHGFRRWKGLAWAGLWIAAAGCGDGTGPTATLPIEATATVSGGAGQLSRTLQVHTSTETAVQVDYWTAASPRLRVTHASTSTDHAVFLPSLRAGEVYEYEVRPSPSGRLLLRGQFTTDTLPTDLAEVHFSAVGIPSTRLTMLELRGAGFAGYVVVDQDGAVVWFRRGVAESFTRRSNGDLVLLENGVGLTVVRPDLSVVAQLPAESGRRMHHDVIATPANAVLFLAQDAMTFDGVTWVGDAIWEWNPEEGTAVRRWRAQDFLSPDLDLGPKSIPSDWLHANSLALGPRGNVLISLPALNQIISIAPDFQTLEWRLGGPRATVVPDDEFWFEHSAAEIAPGRVLLFDNGRDRPAGLFSRALELELDLASGRATTVWEFRPQPTIYAPIVGSARRLPNGNTFVDFGTSRGIVGASGPITVVETTPGGQVTWQLRIDGAGLINYRATPLAAIAGEVVVPPPRNALP